jgi:hypothetical protein
MSPSGVTYDKKVGATFEAAEAFASTPFDYIIIGGGTAGLPLATR